MTNRTNRRMPVTTQRDLDAYNAQIERGETARKIRDGICSLFQAFSYLSTDNHYIDADDETVALPWHRPIENAAYCIQFAEV